MSWDPVWEEIFRSSDWGKYPPEELVRFVARNFYKVPDRRTVRMLELGCGTGANIWYMAREGFDVSGVDGSASAIGKAQQRMKDEGLAVNLAVGDISKLPGAVTPPFDAIIDVCCLQHNPLSVARSTLSRVYEFLRPRGRILEAGKGFLPALRERRRN